MKKIKSAFSLMELSVVIIIVGILVAGVSQGSRIMTESRLKTAQSLTNGAPINTISDLVLWLDATDPTTIATGSGSGVYTNNPSDGEFVTSWRDRNPQNTTHIEFSALADTNRPKYFRNGIGGLPDLSFDGIDDFLQYTTSTGLLNSGVKKHTIIMVFSVSSTAATYLFSQGNGCNGGNSGMSIIGSLYSIGCATGDFAGPGLSANIAYSGVVRVDNSLLSNQVKIFVNKSRNSGTPTIIDATNGNVTLAARFDGQVGSAEHISEVLVFSRALSDNEILSIQAYLAQKYKIKM